MATEQRWLAFTRELGVPPDGRTYRRVVRAWKARSRHYHSLAHLEACLSEFDKVRDLAVRPAEVELALWFHDAVYKTYSKNNEERSAEWAVAFLTMHAVELNVSSRVRRFIMATRHAASELTNDAALVVDIDLSILGQRSDVYAQFERDVRKEYWWVSKRRYVTGRTAILESFLARQHIFLTDTMRARYEATARVNLEGAIRQLRSS